MNVRHRFTRSLQEESARDEIYLANHSLGRPLDETAINVQRGLDLWYSRMGGAWESDAWTAETTKFRSLTAQLLGLPRHDSVVPKTSAAQGLRAVLNSFPQDQPLNVVTTEGEFDSIDFVLKAYEHLGRAHVRRVSPSVPNTGVPSFSAREIADAIEPTTDLVVVSLVFFTTSEILTGVEGLIKKAHQNGALVLLDLYHAAGVIPIDFMELEADFSIGGSYKYLRGGPGACWLAIHPRHLESRRRTLDTGWFAKKEPFGYDRKVEPEWAEGGDSWLESTPPILTSYQAVPGLELTLELGIDNIRRDSLAKNQILREALRKSNVELFQPKNAQEYGAFSLLVSDQAQDIAELLCSKGINVDARGTFVRFCPDCVTTTEEVETAAVRIAKALS